jgi:hypothetical protein
MNKSILDTIIENRGGHYCHCVEVSEVYELENIAESIIDEFPDLKYHDYMDFFKSLTVYSLDDNNRVDIFSFSFSKYIKGSI